MWKMNANGSNDHHNMSTEQVSLSKLLPSNPKPKFACSSRTGRTTVLIPPCSTCSHSTTSNLLELQHHLAKASDEQNMMELNEQAAAAAAALGSTSRWNPTPEQILTLEEMYRRGMRTPSADQIQLIAEQLRRFGKIEGKNVFYWFQNHKARERQRRRREVETRCRQRKHDHVESLDKKEAGLRTSYELEQTKKMMTTPPPNRNKHPEGLVSLHRTAVPDNRTHGWSEYEERELQQQQRNCCLEKHSTWRTMAINTSMILQRQQQTDDEGNHHHDHDHGHQGVKTLKLFPIGNEDADCTSSSTSVSSGTMSCSSRKDTNNEVPITAINTNFSPNQFFEFLPLKN